MYNRNKIVTATATGLLINYLDSAKFQSIHYDGKSPLKKIQTKPSSKHQPLRITQKKLYNDVMFGLKSYSEKEKNKLSESEKRTLLIRHTQAHELLENWKQEVIHQKLGSFLTTFFRKSKFAKDLATYNKGKLPWEKNRTSFSELGIRKKQIVEKLIERSFLPSNYYELDEA